MDPAKSRALYENELLDLMDRMGDTLRTRLKHPSVSNVLSDPGLSVEEVLVRIRGGLPDMPAWAFTVLRDEVQRLREAQVPPRA